MATSPELEGCYRYPLIGYRIKRWKPKALPESLNIDGKHIWEPPIFAYNHLIGEEYEKKREAVMKYTKGDRAKTTKILDIDVENNMLDTYWDWVKDNMLDARDSGDSARASFFAGLWSELQDDSYDVEVEYDELEIEQKRMDDGTWKIMDIWKYHERGERWSDESSFYDTSSESSVQESYKTESDNEDEAPTNDPRISTAATDAEELNWLSSIDPQAFPPMQSDEEADTGNEESQASSDSDAYADARSTISEHDSGQGDKDVREAKRRRLDFYP